MKKKTGASSELPQAPPRMPSGVRGLDTLLKGGFVKGGVYLVLGPPGSGKTILGNQICFNHAKAEQGNVVYVTLLAESHTRMMSNLRSLDYFQDELVARSVHYMSGYRVLEKDGLKGLLLQIASMVREHKATLLMIDGITTIGDMDQSALAFRIFTHELNTFISNSGCTAFLLSSMDGDHSKPEHTMVDGIVALHHRNVGLRAMRQIEVRKFRGSDHLQGRHLFRISEHGIRVYPRAESLVRVTPKRSESLRRLSFEVPHLDEMLGGGVITNSITTVIGAAGTGKTILGLQFLRAGLEAGEAGLFFGFYETPDELLDKSRQLGLGLDKWFKQGLLTIHWSPALEQELDELGEDLIEAVVESGAKRVVIDGVDGFRYSTSFKKRVNRFMVALTMKLKTLGVTLFLIEEISLFQSHHERQVAELSALNENLLYLRHLETENKLTRVISVIKIRTAIYDHSVREFHIGKNGVNVLGAIRRAKVDKTG